MSKHQTNPATWGPVAFAFNRLHGSARSRDGELCSDIQKTRARIERAMKETGYAL